MKIEGTFEFQLYQLPACNLATTENLQFRFS